MNYVFPSSAARHYRFPTHTNDLVIDRSECATSEVFWVVLSPGEAPPLHKHDDTEQIFIITEGKGLLRIGTPQEEHEVAPGDLVRVPPHVWHSIQCHQGQALKYLAIDCFTGGVPKAEPTWDSHVRVMCRQNGWNYQQVMERSARPAG